MAFPKGQTRPEAKAAKRQIEENIRRAVKREVFQREQGKCRCCGGPAQELHELRFRSLGGKRSLKNSIAVCNYRGKNCHRLLQVHVIKVELLNHILGANAPLLFRRDGKEWTR
jgi:hypothetical protein